MRILLTGANGQLGQHFLQTAASGDHAVIAAYHSSPPPGWQGEAVALDLASGDALARVVAKTRPDWLVHGAAMTDVDGCERDPAKATLLNGTATGVLAKAATAAGARFLYVSTDYVYSGADGPYEEGDVTEPIQAYGVSKLQGEREVLAAAPDAVIARTAVVYGPHKKNLVTWLVGELRAGRPVKIVEDQLGSPTLTKDLSEQILALVAADASGLYHTAGGEACSRLHLARRVAAVFGLPDSLIAPSRMADMKWLAKRPADARLETQRIAKLKRPYSLDASLEALKGMMP